MKKWIALILVLALTGVCACAYAEDLMGLFGGITSLFGGEDGEVYGVGEAAELSSLTVKLTDVMESHGSGEYRPADGYEYLIFEFKIKNTSDEEMPVSSLMCFSAWCDNRSCTISIDGLAVAALSGKLQFDRVLDPGKSEKGVVAYEVPEDWTSAKIHFTEDGFGGDTATFIVEK